MRKVFSVNDVPWQNLRGLPGARGFEYKALSDADYSAAFNAELVRLEPVDHSVPHVEPWSHLLYFLSGTGDVTIDGESGPSRRALYARSRFRKLFSSFKEIVEVAVYFNSQKTQLKRGIYILRHFCLYPTG